MEQLSQPFTPPREVARARALLRLVRGESVETVAADVGIERRHLRTWFEALSVDGFYGWLKKQEPDTTRLKRAKEGIAQILLGLLAEEHFESLAVGLLGDKGYSLQDQRVCLSRAFGLLRSSHL